MRCASWIIEECAQRLRIDVRVESLERIALAVLAHDGRPGDQPKGIERHFGPVSVGVDLKPRRQHAVIDLGPRDVAKRIDRFDRHEVVRVEPHVRRVAERIDIAARHEEVSRSVVQLVRRVRFRFVRVEHATRRRPPLACAAEVDVAAFSSQRRGVGANLFPEAARECRETIVLA